MKKHLLCDLFFTFFKIGLFTFGGGYAMISVLESICVEKKKWMTQEEMMTLTVVAESTPGPIAINCSTYIGFQQAGFWGAVLCTFGVVLPSFLIIYLISMFLDSFLEIEVIAHAFQGIQVAVGLLILGAGLRLQKNFRKNVMSYAILIISFLALLAINLFTLQISSSLLMLISAGVGLICFSKRTTHSHKEDTEA